MLYQKESSDVDRVDKNSLDDRFDMLQTVEWGHTTRIEAHDMRYFYTYLMGGKLPGLIGPRNFYVWKNAFLSARKARYEDRAGYLGFTRSEQLVHTLYSYNY